MIARDALLRVLYETAGKYKLRAGRAFVETVVVARIVIKPNGEYSFVEKIEAKNKALLLPRRVFTSQDKKSYSRFLVEKPGRVLCTDKKNKSSYDSFVNQIKDCAEKTNDIGLRAVLNFYKKSNSDLRSKIADEVKKILGSKHQYAEVTFAIYGRVKNLDVLTTPVKRWWRTEFTRQINLRFSGSSKRICQITTKRDVIPNRNPLPVSGLGSLVSANFPAATFSGYDSLESSHIGLEAGIDIAIAMEHISRNRLVHLGKRKTTKYSIDETHCILSWFCNPSSATRHDEITVNGAIIGFPKDMLADEDEWSHIAWIRSKFYGGKILRPDESQDHEYCSILVETNMGRLVLQEVCFLTISMLRKNVVKWVDDISLSCRLNPRFIPVKRAMHLLSNEGKTVPSHVCKTVHGAFFNGSKLGIQYLGILNNKFRSIILKKEGPLWDVVALLKMLLIRKGVDMPTEWTLDKAEQSPAFAIGSVLALTAFAQDPKNKGKESSIPSRFLVSCGTNPARTNFSLLRYFNIYTKRMSDSRGLAYLLQRARGSLVNHIGEWPTSMTHVQRSELAVGFSMMREALFRHKLSELFPNIKKEKTNEE